MNSARETADSGRHVVDRVLDYVEGRLTPQQSRDVEQHLQTCLSCAADFRWAGDLRRDALQAGLRHLAPDRLAALSESGLTSEEAAHVADCETCRAESEWARRVPMPIPGDARAPKWSWRQRIGDWSMPRFAWSLAGAVAVIALVVLFRADDDPRRLARIEPLPAPAQRAVPEPGSFEEAFANGLARYAVEDWRGAETAFEQAAARAPDRPEGHLYLGSVRLLQGRTRDAVSSLTRATEATASPAADPRIAEEARWQLAQSLLKQGDTAAARALLSEIQSNADSRGEEAALLIEQVDAVMGRGR